MKKRIVALLLTLVMVISVMPINVFAEAARDYDTLNTGDPLDKNGDGEVIYVSLGDSTTNGYGLTGYELDLNAYNEWIREAACRDIAETYYEDVNLWNLVYNWYSMFGTHLITDSNNMNGLLMETPKAYPALFRDYLDLKTELPVNLIQLAISGARADSIYSCLTYGTDTYPYDGSDGNTSSTQYAHLTQLVQAAKGNKEGYEEFKLPFDWRYEWGTVQNAGGDAAALNARLTSVSNLFKNSIAYADIISVNMGSNNFSTYLHNYLKGYMMGGNADVAGTVDYQSKIEQFAANHPDYPDLDKKATELVVALKAELNSQIISGIEDEKLQQVIDGLIDRCVYTFVGYCVSYVGVLEEINKLNPKADIVLMNMVNFMDGFTLKMDDGSTLDLSKLVGMSLDMSNDYAALIANEFDKDEAYTNNIYYANVGDTVDYIMDRFPTMVKDNFEGYEVLRERMITSLGWWVANLSPENDLYANGYDVYPFLMINNKPNAQAAAMVQDYFNGDMTEEQLLAAAAQMDLNDAALNALVLNAAIYLGIERTAITCGQMDSMKASAFMAMFEQNYNQQMTAVFSDMIEEVEAIAEAGTLESYKAVPDAIHELMTNNELAQGFFYFTTYFQMGDGVACHPSEIGYQTEVEGLIDAYEKKTAPAEIVDIVAWTTIRDILCYLDTNNYLTAEEKANIVMIVSGFLTAGEDMNNVDTTVIFDELYCALFDDDNLSDAQRMAIVHDIVAILDSHYEIINKNSNAKAVTNIVDYLYKNEYIDDEQAFMIVNFIYWTVNDGIQDDDIMDIVKFVYLVVFDGMRAAMFAVVDDMDDPSLTASQKMEILMTVYGEFKAANPTIVDENPELVVVENLYSALTEKDENGESLLNDEQLFAIFDTAIKSLVIDEKPSDEAIKDITNEVNVQIETLPAEKKLAVLEEIGKAVEDLGNIEGGTVAGSANSMATIAEYMQYFEVIRKIVENLRAEGLWSDVSDLKFNALTSGLITKLMNNEEIEYEALAKDAYEMLLGQPNLTAMDKLNIIKIIYETLEEYGIISEEIIENALLDAIDYLKAHAPEYYAEAYAYAIANGYIDIAIDAIDTAIAAIKTIDLSNTQITPESQANIATELAAVIATLEEIKAALVNGDAETLDDLIKTVMALEDDLYIHLDNLAVFAKQAGENIYEMVYLPLKAIVINEVIPTVKKMVNEVLTQIQIYMLKKICEAYDIVIDVNDTVEDILDAVRDHIEHITEGEVEITDDTFYLAIVNGEEGYADLVAAALYLTEDQYKKVTAEELTAEDLARATLITVGYNTNSVVTFTADQLLGVANVYVQDAMEFVAAVDAKMEANYANLMEKLGVDIYDTVMGIVNAQAGQYLAMVEGKEAVAIDWEALVGAEYAAYVEAAKAELRAALIENNIPETYVPVTIDIAAAAAQLIAEYTDNLVEVNVEELKAALGEHAVFTLEIPVADLAVFAAESAVYEFIAYNKAYSELVMAINEVNPDATVALLGNYNRFDIDYEIVTEEVSFTLAEVLAELGFEGFKLPEEAKAAIAELAAMGVYEIEIPTDKYVDAVMGEYNKAIDFVVNFEIPAYVAEAELLIADLVEICNAYVERAVDRIADVYTISIPVADLVNAVVEKGYKLDDLINASLNTEIVIEGRTIEANDVLDLLANLSSIHPFAYTTVFYNMFYVDVADALVGGDEYIAEQIMNGLAAQCIHVYDDECTDTTCNRCGAIREVPGHTPGAEATCTEDQICLVCGEILVKAEGHKPGAEATCTDDQICLVCGEILVKAEGHKPGAAATCTRDQKCTVCGAVLAEAHGHRAGAAATCTTAQTCKVCGLVITPALGHKPGAAATCTTAQTCTVCGAVVAPATGHKAGAAATCTADQKCTVCGEVLAKATGHKWTDATCKAPKTCSVCGATEGSVAAHKFGDWVVTKEAAAGVEGSKTRTCSVCGATETEKIAALPVETTDPKQEPTQDPTQEPTNEPTQEPTTEPTEPGEPKEGLSTGAIVGISAASVAVVGGAGVAVWFALKKKKLF